MSPYPFLFLAVLAVFAETDGVVLPAKRGDMTARLTIHVADKGVQPGVALVQFTLTITGGPLLEVETPRCVGSSERLASNARGLAAAGRRPRRLDRGDSAPSSKARPCRLARCEAALPRRPRRVLPRSRMDRPAQESAKPRLR